MGIDLFEDESDSSLALDEELAITFLMGLVISNLGFLTGCLISISTEELLFDNFLCFFFEAAFLDVTCYFCIPFAT